MKRDFVSILDLSLEELNNVLDLASELKEKQKKNVSHELLKSKQLAMIFQKPSTRTRVSFEVGISQLGGHGMYLGPKDLQLNRGETIADTAKVLSRYCDIIMARVFSHDDIVTLAENASVPVINGLSDLLHPCQALADIFTIKEKKGKLENINLVFIGDGNNVAHSLMLGSAMVGMNCKVITPKGYEPDKKILEKALKEAKSKIETSNDIEDVKDADIIYTDVWASMGQEKEEDKRKKVFLPYQVNSELMKKTNALFMHCLPAHRGEEVTDRVADSKQSIIFDQAENRLHAQKALMVFLCK